MGQRSTTDTLAGIYQAFLAHRVWKQADLARELDIGTEAVRRVLLELQSKGMPLEREQEGGQVFWSVPRDWFPGGVAFKQEEVPELLRQLQRIPHGQGRKRLLDRVLERLPVGARVTGKPVVVAREASAEEEKHLGVVEDSARRQVTLHMRYLTAGRVDEGSRSASVQRVLLGPPTRFVAICHRDGKLKTFRVDGILDARLDAAEAFRPAADDAVEKYVRASLDGFHDEGPAREVTFFVRNPDARWVKKNLLDGMKAESAGGDGIRVTANTAAVRQVARFVVGLGAAAVSESPELAREVETLARGAIEGCKGHP